jgi:hypothetical protein
MYHLDALFLTEDYFGSEFCPFLLEALGTSRSCSVYQRLFFVQVLIFNKKRFSSGRCASAANVVCKDVDVF